jgi:hypothetical protein
MGSATVLFTQYAQLERASPAGYHNGTAWLSWVSNGIVSPFVSSNPENLFASDNLYCNLQYADFIPPLDAKPLAYSGNSGYIIVKGNDKSQTIPSDATITGITVYIERQNFSDPTVDGALIVTDDSLFLTKDGSTTVGTDWFGSNTKLIWNYGTDEIKSFGGTTHMWGTTWTPAELNANTFGVFYAANITKSSGGDDAPLAKIDQIYVVVTYAGGTTADNINPYGIRSTEFVTSLHRIRRNINEYAVRSIERLGLNTLRKAAAQIRPYGLISAQNLGQARLASRRNINPYSIKSNEVLGRNSLRSNIKFYSVKSLESLSQNKFVLSIKPFGILSVETISQSRLIQNIKPYAIKSNEVLGNQSLKQNISPFSVKSIEVLGFDKLVTNINPYPIRSVENLGRNSLLSSANISSISIKTNEIISYGTRLSSGTVINHISIKTEKLGQNTLFPTNQIRKIGIASDQIIGITRLSASYNIIPKSINSLENVGYNRFSYRFYDTLDYVDIFTFGNKDSFLWEQANSIFPGGKTLRRSTAFPNTAGVQTIALPMLYDRGPDFYWSGYLQILSGNGIAGMAFGIQSSNVNNGYHVVINAANTSVNPSFSIRKIVGVTSTTIASYNLAGLVNLNSLFRITVTWSSTGLITAKLYNQGAGSLVTAAELSVTDTTYTTGYIGITAFSDTAFDHLTNIQAQFADPVYNITSLEKLGLPTLTSAAASIRHYSVVSIEKTNNLVRLLGQYNITSRSIQSLEILGNNTRLSSGSANINPYSINTVERLAPQQNRLFSQGSQIIHLSLVSTEKLGSHNLRPGGLSLRPYGILTNEQLGYNRVNFNYNLRPYSVLSLERISLNTLSTIKSINPRAIVSIEKLGNSALSLPIYSIRPLSIVSIQNLSSDVRLNSFKNILPFSTTSIEIIGQARFTSIKSILPYSINSIEKLGHLSSLRTSANILPYSIKSTESLGYNRLTSIGQIKPYSIVALEKIGFHALSSLSYIRPYAIRSTEILGNRSILGSLRNISPYAVISIEKLSLNALISIKSILPYSVKSLEKLSYNSLNTSKNINPYSIFSLESIGRNTLSISSVFITPKSIISIERIGLNTLTNIAYIRPFGTKSIEKLTSLISFTFGSVSINPYSIKQIEIFGRTTLSGQTAYILPYSLKSLELGSSLSRFTTTKNINPYSIKSIELLGREIVNFNYNISPYGFYSLEKLGIQTLRKNAYNIIPYSLLSAEILGQHRLSTVKNILPYSIKTIELLGRENLTSSIRINHISLLSIEKLTSLVRLSAQSPGILPYSIKTSENLGLHRLSTFRSINPYSIKSIEILGRQTLTYFSNIRPYSVLSLEKTTSFNKLTGSIKPYSVKTIEILGRQTLSPLNAIYPYAVRSTEALGLNKFISFIKPYSVISTESTGSGLRFRNRFYDPLEEVNVFSFGNVDQFIWEQANSIYTGGKTLRRSTAFPNTSGTATIAYPLEYLRGTDFYWAGYLQVLSGSGIAGLAFGVQASDVRSGYFAVINTTNTTVNPSFSLRRAIGGTSTVLASYNLPGLIVPNSLYRIIVTWSNAGTITANLYAQAGGSLVSAATLVATDTTYTKGYMGITAFSDAAFDNLTNIEAQFFNPLYGIPSNERLGLATFVQSGVFINLLNTGIKTVEKVGLHRVSANYNITPKSIIGIEKLGLHTFSSTKNIYPFSVISLEKTAALNVLFALGSEIRPFATRSTEKLGLQTLLPSTVFIRPYSLLMNSNLGLNRLSVNANIIPFSITSNEKLGIDTLQSLLNIRPYSVKSLDVVNSLTRLSVSAINIRPYSIISFEKLGFHRLSSNNYINPYSIISLEKLGYHRLSSTNNIYPYPIVSVEKLGRHSISSGGNYILPYSQISNEKLGVHTLRTNTFILPFNLKTLENIGLHTLNSNININPYGIRTLENLGQHRLTNVARILPYSTISIEKLGLHTLQSKNYIYPYSIITLEKLGLNSLSTIGVSIRPYSVKSLEILGLHTLRASNNIYPYGIKQLELLGLHKLRSDNYIYPFSIKSIELLGIHKLTSAKNILPYSIISVERLGLHSLSGSYQILPYSIKTIEILGLHTLANIKNINPYGIITNEVLGLHTLRSAKNIYPYSIVETYKVGYHTLSSLLNIRPYSIQSNEILGLHTLTNAKNIYPYSIKSIENPGLHAITYATLINPYSIISVEKLGQHRLSTVAYIYPYGTDTPDSGTGAVMTLRYGQYIYLNNSWSQLPGYGPIVPTRAELNLSTPSFLVSAVSIQPHSVNSEEKASYHRLSYLYPITPYSIVSEQNIGFHRLVNPPALIRPTSILETNGFGLHLLQKADYNILPYAIISQEKLGLHRLTTFVNIKPYSVVSNEYLGLHKLTAIKRIYPYTQTSMEAIGYHELRRGDRIFPFGIATKQDVHNGNAEFSLFRINGLGTSTEIFLTNDGTNVVYWNSTVYTYAVVKVNSNTLSTGYTLYPLEGKVIFDTPLNSTDTVSVNVYRNSKQSLHTLYYESFIKPWGIRSIQRLPRHKLKLPQFPGFIHAWFEKKQTIESEVTIVNLPIVAWAQKVQSIEVDIQILEDMDSTLTKVQTIDVGLNYRSTS